MKSHFLGVLLAGAYILTSVQTYAQTPLTKPSLSDVTHVSPYYFGPNAFAVPEMLDGRVQRELRVELAGDYFKGFRGDHTADMALKVNIPLWTDRVNLSLWMPVIEWYKNSDESLDASNILPEHRENARKGCLSGDVYVSADIQLLKERRWRPDWVVRATLKTASGGEFFHARYYDSPGYFFDTAVGKSFMVGGNTKWNHRLRAALSTGFLCWQTDNGRQNDAVQFGVTAKWENRYFTLAETFAGYSGWEHNAGNGGDTAHDSPMVLRTDFIFHIKQFDVVAAYQYGLHDYPFHQVRVGVAYRWDILKLKH
ncbi:MAG: hypothetical protein IJQ59_00405 [Bacteroidaceae bacterium]|nr:hypothetical protein [Bacteroidaceae bacterium]